MKYSVLSTTSRPRSAWLKFASASLIALAVAGCGGGSDGAPGATGAAGAAGAAGATGPAGPTIVAVDATNLTFDDLKNRALAGKVLSVDTSGNQPVVKFQVVMKDTNEGVRGLRTFALHIDQLKPEVNGSASYWQNYIADGLPLTATPASSAAPSVPSADAVTSFNTDGTVKGQGYSTVDNGDGTYAVTFGANIKANTKVVYDATLVHRVVVGVRSVAVPGVVGKTAGAYAGPINPTTGAVMAQFVNTSGANFAYDFTPAASGPGTMLVDSAGKQTFARDNVTIDACNQCHYKIQYGFPKGNNTSGHFGARTDTKTCVMCHTPQLANGTGEYTIFIHQIHMGEELPAVVPATSLSSSYGANEVKYPQDIRQCATCHKGTVTDSFAKSTIKACGACHNNVDFATGANHIGGSKADDKQCALCHGVPDIKAYHVPVTAVPSATSGITSQYANNGNLPTGAFKIDYVINSVTVDSTRNVSVKFQILKNGTAVNFGTYNASTNPNIVPGTVGGPSLRIAYNVSQDGITSPADFNASMSAPGLGIGAPTVPSTATPPGTFTAPSTTSSVWVTPAGVTSGGITWTMTGPDATNAYTIKSSLALPASTTMVSALMYGSMTETTATGYPYAAASIADFTSYVSGTNTAYAQKKPGLIVSPANALKASTSTGFTARRTVVDNAKCNSCHDQLGVKPNFHGGGRNDGTDCHICHTQNGVNTGWSYAANTFIHAIHGPAQRTTNYTFAAASATDGFFTVGYPGLLKNCEQCHLSGTYDFSATASAAAVGKQLANTVGTGTTAAPGVNTAPYIAQAAGTKYGNGYSFVAPGNAAAAYTLADGVTAGTWTDLATNTSVASLTALTNTKGAIRPAEGTTLVSSPISAACFSCHDSATAMSHMELNGGSLYDARTGALAKTETCLVCHGAVSTSNITNNTTPAIKAVHRWW